MRGVDLIVFILITEVMGVETVSSVMATMQAVVAIPETVALFDVVSGLTTPITYLVVVCAPSVYGAVTNGDFSLASSFGFEIGGLVHVAINVAVYVGDGNGRGEAFRALVHGESFSL